jgi:hypothetical protein
MGEMRNGPVYRILARETERKRLLKHLSRDARMILKWIFIEYRMSTRSSGGLQ